MSYEKGWNDAHKAIADYVEKEICLVTAEMIRRMKSEKWRKGQANATVNTSANTVNNTGISGDV